jgi:dolichol-phosphate mannosyltransferase
MADRRLPGLPKVLILLPTYNERENLPLITEQLLDYADLRVMVIDDGSPDGTGALADQIAAASGGRLSVVHRTGKRGLGRSYLDGMRAALATDA